MVGEIGTEYYRDTEAVPGILLRIILFYYNIKVNGTK